jgi:hypothetical protein
MTWLLGIAGICLIAQLADMSARDREDVRMRKERGWIADDERKRRLRNGDLIPGVNYFGSKDF